MHQAKTLAWRMSAQKDAPYPPYGLRVDALPDGGILRRGRLNFLSFGRLDFLSLAHTNPAQGIDALEKRRPKLHYVRFQSEAEKQTFADEVQAQLDRAQAQLEFN